MSKEQNALLPMMLEGIKTTAASTMKIIHNNIKRPLVALADAPADVLAEFDYIVGDDQYSPRMFKYRGVWYDTHDMMAIRPADSFNCHGGPHTVFHDWHAYVSETFFSGVLIKHVGDDEIIVGRYMT